MSAARRGNATQRAARAEPAVEYPPGHFLEPVRAWFGATWQPQWPTLVKRDYSGHSIEHRERQAKLGIAWGKGTVMQPRTPVYGRPGWL